MKINQPTPINRNVVIGSIVGGFVLISCIVFLFMKMGSAPKTETKSGDVLSGKSLLEDKPDIFDTMPKTYRMPMGWSKTDKEKTGFDSIWPVKGGTAGFTMVERELTVRGMPNEYWSYTDIEKKITYTIESLKLSEVESNDFENTKKRFVEKIRRVGLNDIQESERELDNRPTLLLVGVKKDTRTTMKIQWTKGHIWTAKVECPLDISFGDSKVWDFLHNFKLD